MFGRRRRCGHHSSPRECTTLPFCSAGQEEARGCANTRQRYRLSVDCYRRAHHVDHSWRTLRSSFERGGWNESTVCGEPAQRGYRFSESIGPAGCTTEFPADAGSLRSLALFPRVRSQSILAKAILLQNSPLGRRIRDPNLEGTYHLESVNSHTPLGAEQTAQARTVESAPHAAGQNA